MLLSFRKNTSEDIYALTRQNSIYSSMFPYPTCPKHQFQDVFHQTVILEGAIGTLKLQLTRKNKYYQARQRLNNYFAYSNSIHYEAMAISKMSLFALIPSEVLTVEYMDSETKDKNIHESRKKQKFQTMKELSKKIQHLQDGLYWKIQRQQNTKQEI